MSNGSVTNFGNQVHGIPGPSFMKTQFGLEHRDFNWKESEIGKSNAQIGIKPKSRRKSSDELKQTRDKPGLHFSTSKPPTLKKMQNSPEHSPEQGSPGEIEKSNESLYSSQNLQNQN